MLFCMADTHRAPIKLRVTRPYDTEDAFLQGDLARLGRGSIVLAETPAMPVGRVVRFEVLLSTGAAVFRGEGTVLAHHGKGGFKPEGLEVRITRTDAKSKAALERAQALRAANKPARQVDQQSGVRPAPTPEPEAAPMPAGRHVEPPPNRDEMLQRLRDRAAKMREHGGLRYETPKR